MFPARIISIDDKVIVEWYNLPEPSAKIYTMPIYYDKALKAYLASKTIAEVENAYQGKMTKRWFAEIRTFFEDDKLWGVEIKKIAINQTVFIEPTENNKVKIVKI